MADKPGDPQKGKADEAAVEADAAAAKEETAVEAVAEEAAASEEAPAEEPKPKRKPRAKKAEATAAAETGEQKDAAEVATKEGSSEPTAEPEPEPEAKPKAKAKKPADRKPKAKKEEAPEEEAPAKEPVAKAAAGGSDAGEAGKAEGPKPAPARKRETGERRVVRAQAKYVRTSARKARLVCDHIRGKDVLEARAILAHTPRSVAEAWTKLLESAVANAEHNHELVGDDLYIKSVTADEGPTLKRFRPRAMGRATKIRKRTSHLTIELTSKE